MSTISARIEKFIDHLPDPASARIFVERLHEEHPQIATRVDANDELCAHILTLAAYSPLLAETMLQRGEYISWLERERDLRYIKPKETLVEELARFAAVNSTLDEAARLVRFKRRELLRIYLRDCLKLATVSETTEELSHLADAVLERALQYCYQPLLARYGTPQTLDERNRLTRAEFSIIGMGKLGSRELNYSSDIDLIFIYEADGETTGRTEVIPNKLFFTKLAEAIVKTVATPFGEGAVFRVDLRLRPRGREGALVVPKSEAIRYYRAEAQNWERQALVRARVTAGDIKTVEQFLLAVRDQIFHPEPLIEALRAVKRAKEKIDSHAAGRSGGYNVKLGKGGIREIEFIIQALQICYGGRDAWLRAPQTLIGLQRLTDKGLISDSEHTRLAQAYNFLRMVEHRLQMEHGLQTHSLPLSEEKLLLLARRCGYQLASDFERELNNHCRNVSTIYHRVFDQTTTKESLPTSPGSRTGPLATTSPVNLDRSAFETLIHDAVTTLAQLPNLNLTTEFLTEAIAAGLTTTTNTTRALRRLRDFALSASTESGDRMIQSLSADQIRELTSIGGSSHYFSQILISYPHMVKLLGGPLTPPIETITTSSVATTFNDAIAGMSLEDAMAELRRRWHEVIIKIGRQDLLVSPAETLSIKHLRAINIAQTALAEASLIIAGELAIKRVLERFQRTDAPLIYTILALGRLGHLGIDYNSDLDLVFIYSDEDGAVVTETTNREFYARVMELTIQILSALKREGMLYRVDLRLRPDGRNGLLATSFDNLQQYLKDRAAIWELMAYLKLRAVGGDPEFGARAEARGLELIFERAAQHADTLAAEVREMRARLQSQKARNEDYKFSAGGMLDVHFATRYLQLRNKIADPPERSTLALIDHFAQLQLINPEQREVLATGYSFLRRLDHQVRLQIERPQTTLPHNPALLRDLACRLGFDDAAQMQQEYQRQLTEIRRVYLEIVR